MTSDVCYSTDENMYKLIRSADTKSKPEFIYNACLIGKYFKANQTLRNIAENEYLYYGSKKLHYGVYRAFRYVTDVEQIESYMAGMLKDERMDSVFGRYWRDQKRHLELAPKEAWIKSIEKQLDIMEKISQEGVVYNVTRLDRCLGDNYISLELCLHIPDIKLCNPLYPKQLLDFGSADVVLSLRTADYFSWELRMTAEVVNKYSRMGMLPHPHIKLEGDVCYGNFREAAAPAVSDGNLLALTEMVNRFVRTYNPGSPFLQLEKFEERYQQELKSRQCAVCKVDFDFTTEREGRDYTRCGRCNERVHMACCSRCRMCGCVVCHNCGGHFTVCNACFRGKLLTGTVCPKVLTEMTGCRQLCEGDICYGNPDFYATCKQMIATPMRSINRSLDKLIERMLRDEAENRSLCVSKADVHGE